MPLDPTVSSHPRGFLAGTLTVACCVLLSQSQGVTSAFAGETDAVATFRERIEPILESRCFSCHAYGVNKGNVAFDSLDADDAVLKNKALWWNVLRNVRAGVMPPAQKERLDPDAVRELASWIKSGPLGIPPSSLDPGRTVLRRLNRAEYRSTIKDLMGFDFRTDEEFPPDDSGHGFDNNGDVLSLSPLLLEKYLQAAETIVAKAVPIIPKVTPEIVAPGAEFLAADGKTNGERNTFYKPLAVAKTLRTKQEGAYKLTLDLAVQGSFDFDPGRARVIVRIDDAERWHHELKWEDFRRLKLEFDPEWQPGEHRLEVELQPLMGIEGIEKKKTFVDLRVEKATLEGPLGPEFMVATKNYGLFFNRPEPPAGGAERQGYARETLARFTERAYRTPAAPAAIDRLMAIAEAVMAQPGKRFEEGIAEAMVAVLASPRFLFRVDHPSAADNDSPFPLVDEPSLATRLSYFLWSSAPDDRLRELAGKGMLRKNLKAEVERMLADERSAAFVRNFVGQWLQARDIESVPINAFVVLRNDGKPARFGMDFDFQLRRAMRLEVESYFNALIKDDGSLLELVDSDYAYLNERLAKHYGIEGVQGDKIRKVTLPAGDPRGGVLTQGALLAVTSNPTRTSPVKRGQFLLDNILGTPAPPPPADVPALEDSGKDFKDKKPTVRQLMEIHRSKPLCNSCHSRMDPLGLALENFNALGLWRDKERSSPIDASGKLITGEAFQDVRDLKKIIRYEHATDFYRCLSEKLLTYAIGRGVEYDDVETVDSIVERLDQENGRFSVLLFGIIESPQFQRMRRPARAVASRTPASSPADPPPPQALEAKP